METLELSTLLVPTDFSPPARAAFEKAVRLIDGENPVIILLHVIDPMLVDFAARYGQTDRDTILRSIRQHAEQELAIYKSGPSDVAFETVISEGTPFLEIIQKADDFAVDAIVMGRVGRRGNLEHLLFGSTAEKVLRGSRKPVIVIPSETPS